ncbi:hypothetical protein FDUTEX481_07559 [Tolypothrix sp. PCC 7601]|nr:hypothetical protein FDUTEX481_07559 [Tolypothrix sp. PCC 7601]BAY89358.1 hypothetical protein NIES3275_13610 [Microchaete diplosiphon NIES-3275]
MQNTYPNPIEGGMVFIPTQIMFATHQYTLGGKAVPRGVAWLQGFALTPSPSPTGRREQEI